MVKHRQKDNLTLVSRCVLAKQIFIPDAANTKDVEFRATGKLKGK